MNHSENWKRLEEMADDLCDWLRRDGFSLEITNNRELDKLIAASVCQGIAGWKVCV